MKKGSIQIETIIIIILALLALVIIAAAFTGGFNQLWGKIMGFGAATTTEAAKAQCSQWCVNGQKTAQFDTYKFTIDNKDQTCANLGVTCP